MASVCPCIKGLTACAQKVHPVLLPIRDPGVPIWFLSLCIEGAIDAHTQCLRNASKAHVHTITLNYTLLQFTAYTGTPFTSCSQSETLSTTGRPPQESTFLRVTDKGSLTAFLRSAARRKLCTEHFILLTWYRFRKW